MSNKEKCILTIVVIVVLGMFSIAIWLGNKANSDNPSTTNEGKEMLFIGGSGTITWEDNKLSWEGDEIEIKTEHDIEWIYIDDGTDVQYGLRDDGIVIWRNKE